jgi:toxin-antitoxin system PIN domain toxin
VLVDVNLLLYAVDERAPEHQRAAEWLEARLNGNRRIGLAWQSLTAFVRISTHPRASDHPLAPDIAWTFVEDWLSTPVVWVPLPTDGHADVLGGLVRKYRLAGNLVPDADLAALAIEHGLEVCSADSDFARFTEVRWRNPLS